MIIAGFEVNISLSHARELRKRILYRGNLFFDWAIRASIVIGCTIVIDCFRIFVSSYLGEIQLDTNPI